MSKINNIRCINLNYNNNRMKIDDETFYLGGKSTLLNLRNGGGKSVLVQMFMAPFMGKRYRDTKDRSFESYFTTNKPPTYILVEWLLDDNAGYLLTGMMIRKKSIISEEDSKDKLDIINFIHEYKDKNAYDINKFPFVVENNGERSLRGFQNSKNLFEDLKKNNSYKFNYYDMNTQSKRYFDKLREFKIDNKEWEKIIKKINLKESGLSELFTSAKNESGLIKEWFIPAVEEKLNQDEDRVEKYRELIHSYINQYKINKNSIENKNKIEVFLELSKDTEIKANQCKDTIYKKEEIENNIANLRNQIIKELKIVTDNILNLDNEDDLLKDKLSQLIYEEISKSIYENEDKKSKENSSLEEKEKESNAKNNELKSAKRRKNILECAKIHKDYVKCSEDTQEIENELIALNKSNEEKIPKINDLGYSIKKVIEIEETDVEKSFKKYSNEIEELKNKEKETVRYQNKLNEKQDRLIENKAVLGERIKGYKREEGKFNREFSLEVNKNIEGYYNEDELILYQNNIIKSIENISKDIKNNTKASLINERKIKITEDEKEESAIKNGKIEYRLDVEKNKLEDMEEKIKKIKNYIKFIDFNENRVFDIEDIKEAFNLKIKDARLKEKTNFRKIDELNKELIKLENGNMIELPLEVEVELKRRGITVLYGMEWLKNNKYSEEKNKSLVEKNRFIPYSLIMNEGDIETLNKNLDSSNKDKIDILENFFIPIIKRQDLEKEIDVHNGIIKSENLGFYIGFNEGLLEQENLNKLLKSKRNEIERLENLNKNIEDEIIIYQEKLRDTINFNLTEEDYNKLKEDIRNLENEKIKYSDKVEKLQKYLIDLKEGKIKLERVIEDDKNKERTLKKNLEAFNELKEAYIYYKKNKLELEKVINEIDLNLKEKQRIHIELEEIQNEVEAKKEVVNNIKKSKENLAKEKIDYLIYKEGNEIKKDKEDLISEYKALTKNINESEKSLRERLNKARERYIEVEKSLIEKTEYYKLEEAEYVNETYSMEKEVEVYEKINSIEEKIKALNDKITHIKLSINTIENTIEILNKDLKEKINKVFPLQREKVFERNFEEEKAKIKALINNIKFQKDIEENKKRILENNKSNLSLYSDLNLKENIELEINYEKLDEDSGKLQRDLININDKISKNENELYIEIEKLQSNSIFKGSEQFIEPLNTMKNLVSKAEEVLEYLNTIRESYKLTLQKINTDLELIKDEEENLIISLFEYVREINENINMIDENSGIIIDGKRRKMLEIIVKDFEENKEIYKVKVKDYLYSVRDGGLRVLEENKNIEEFIGNNVKSIKIYDEVVNINSIGIKLYKIEESRQIKITWGEVSKNSGGEGFLSAFVILSSLLSYMGKDESDIFSKNISGKVIIMDNPFAQTNSAHLLKPLMDIAKKSNTQLICLTGLGGDSIYGRFENIYVLNLIESKLVDKTYLKGKHMKGEEEEETLIASRFDIEDYNQIRLF